MDLTVPAWLAALKGHHLIATDEPITISGFVRGNRVACVCGWIAPDDGPWAPWSTEAWPDHVLYSIAMEYV